MSGEGYCSRVADFIRENNALLACAARMSIAGFSELLADRSMPRYLYFLTTWIFYYTAGMVQPKICDHYSVFIV